MDLYLPLLQDIPILVVVFFFFFSVALIYDVLLLLLLVLPILFPFLLFLYQYNQTYILTKYYIELKNMSQYSLFFPPIIYYTYISNRTFANSFSSSFKVAFFSSFFLVFTFLNAVLILARSAFALAFAAAFSAFALIRAS